MNAPIFLDFEATGLHKLSYPIQVVCGGTLDDVEDWYIRPAKGWTFWSLEAEEMHRLSRELLAEVGRPAREVAERMNAVLAGKVVYADGLPWDNFWLDELFQPGQSPVREGPGPTLDGSRHPGGFSSPWPCRETNVKPRIYGAVSLPPLFEVTAT